MNYIVTNKLFVKLKLTLLLLLISVFGVLASVNSTLNTASLTIADQQERTVTGTVVDENGDPVPGATVKVKGTSIGTITELDGKFSITVPDDDAILVISYVGMGTQEIAVGGRSVVNVSMATQAVGVDDVIVVGYGTQKKATLIGAVTTVDAEQIETIPTSNLSNILAGRLSGVHIQQTTGTPGIPSNIRVRSAASWNRSVPLYVIDGVVRDVDAFNALDPNEVDQISVLKDAASAAIYGARSANGVILVTTKKGKSGKAKISYSGAYSQDKPVQVPEMVSPYEAAVFNKSIGHAWSDEELEHMKTLEPNAWYDAAYQDPVRMRHALNITGGSDKINYFIGGSYFDERGFLPNLNYDKYNIRGNLNAAITDDLSVELNLSNSYGDRQRFNFTYDWGSADLNNLWGKLLYFFADVPPYIDGKPNDPGWLGNMVERMKNGGYWNSTAQNIDALFTAKYDIPFVDGLSVKGTYSKNIVNDKWKIFDKKQLLYVFKRTGANGRIYTNEVVGTKMSGDPGRERLATQFQNTDSYQGNVQLDYNRVFNDRHDVSAALVYEVSEGQNEWFYARRYDFPIITKDQFFATSDDSKDSFVTGNAGEVGRSSYIGRINYSLDDKYLFQASVRRDGSMLFAPGKRWGWFPAAGAGWLISEESFFNSSKVDFLKLRASVGLTGSDAVGGWQWLEKYNPASGFYFGNGNTKGVSYGGVTNKDLTWEKTLAYNVGVDSRLFKDFSVTAEYWFRNTYDILGRRILSLPSTLGANLPAENYGEVHSNGFELELGYDKYLAEDFNLFAKANLGYATNKVITRDVAENTLDVDNPIGRPLGYLRTYVVKDILRTQADLDALPAGYRIFGYTPQLGMFNYEDVSGVDGVPDGKIDGYDRQVVKGNSSPPFTYGLNFGGDWKGFSLDALIQGVAGVKKMYSDGYGRRYTDGQRAYAFWRDSWSPENPNAEFPKIVRWNGSPAHVGSSFWLRNSSFARLKYLNLGYKLPTDLSGKVGLSNLQLTLSGTNLLTLTKYKFHDPEIGSAMSYPNTKTFTIGLNATI